MKNKRHIKQIKDRLNAVKAAIRQEEIQNHDIGSLVNEIKTDFAITHLDSYDDDRAVSNRRSET